MQKNFESVYIIVISHWWELEKHKNLIPSTSLCFPPSVTEFQSALIAKLQWRKFPSIAMSKISFIKHRDSISSSPPQKELESKFLHFRKRPLLMFNGALSVFEIAMFRSPRGFSQPKYNITHNECLINLTSSDDFLMRNEIVESRRSVLLHPWHVAFLLHFRERHLSVLLWLLRKTQGICWKLQFTVSEIEQQLSRNYNYFVQQ